MRGSAQAKFTDAEKIRANPASLDGRFQSLKAGEVERMRDPVRNLPQRSLRRKTVTIGPRGRKRVKHIGHGDHTAWKWQVLAH